MSDLFDMLENFSWKLIFL